MKDSDEGAVDITRGETGEGQMGNGLWQSVSYRSTGRWVLFIKIMDIGKRSWQTMNSLYSCSRTIT